ncbi:MAG: hypothetical protein WCJ95_19075 [Mariniphaga sp.]
MLNPNHDEGPSNREIALRQAQCTTSSLMLSKVYLKEEIASSL